MNVDKDVDEQIPTRVNDALMEASGLQNGSQPVPKRLACRPCQRRKIKCSREFPCVQCEEAGISCEQSLRKKRARPRIGSKREDDLRNRVASLEKLVHKLNGDEPPSHAAVDVLPSANKYLASPFWSSLAVEVQALRDALEEEEDGSDQEPTESATGSSHSTSDYTRSSSDPAFEFILCGPNNILVLPDALYEPDPFVSSSLLNIYLDRVDRTWKILHTPSLRGLMENGTPYLGRESNAPCNQALKAAIHFTAISQLTDDECENLYGQPRAAFLDSFRRTVEMKLIQSDPMNTTALATLQALVLYVTALRRTDVSRRSWSIFGLVVRLARALNLHRESNDETFYMRELRRRLWHNIIVMDTFFALDRGSEALITLGSFSRPLPSNLNDIDFEETSASAPPRKEQVTDMTFALVVEELSACIHRINFLEDKPASETWQQRLQLAKAQEKDTEEKYLRFCNPEIDFHRLIVKVASVVLTGLTLRAVRPMQRDPSHTLPPIDSPWVFELAVETIRKCCAIGEDIALAKWKQLAWVQWHPIAVVLAGLCAIKNLDQEQEADAWQLIDRMMIHSSRFVADTRKGSLWQPIEKLYKKALASKTHRPADVSQNHHPVGVSSTGIELFPNRGCSNASQPLVSTNGESNDIFMSEDSNADDFAAFLETNNWLEWDAIIADMNAASSENNILWA